MSDEAKTLFTESVEDLPLEESLAKSYLDYSMSVITSRAIPDVRDGLKPVQRRILYAMLEMGLTPDKPFKKCARVIGEVLGKYHPHGDAAVYDAMVRMAQDFTMRYPLLEGHGNFGSIDRDPPAAYRYTEIRLAPVSLYMLADIKKDTVDFVDNFDATMKEPTVLPSRFPNLLVNGTSGIAVGMSSNIPPHNLREVVDGLVAVLEGKVETVADLMEYIKGPDFPTGGVVVNAPDLHTIYEKGTGVVWVRAKMEVEERGRKRAIVITEIPYGVSKADMVAEIAAKIKEGKLPGVRLVRDESDRRGLRVVLELSSKVEDPQKVINLLCKESRKVEHFVNVSLLAIVDGVPRTLSLLELARHYLQHQREVVVRRAKWELGKAKDRLHIVEGLVIAVQNIDEVVEIVKTSDDTPHARRRLEERFNLTPKQSEAITSMRLSQLPRLETEKLFEEREQLEERIDYLQRLLASPEMVDEVVKEELLEVKKKFGDERRTEITSAGRAKPGRTIIPKDCLVFLTDMGMIKRTPVSVVRTLSRGSKGGGVRSLAPGEKMREVVFASTVDHLLGITREGRAYKLLVDDLPEKKLKEKGLGIRHIIDREEVSEIHLFVPYPKERWQKYLFLVSASGRVKRINFSEVENINKAGKIVASIEEGDELVAGFWAGDEGDVLLFSSEGNCVRFPVEEVRVFGRAATGVIGMRVREGKVVSADYLLGDEELLVLTEHGYGKRVHSSEFRRTHRGTMGFKGYKVNDRVGKVVAVHVLRNARELVVVTERGKVLRVEINSISQQKRYSSGVRIISLEEGDRVSSSTVF